MWRYLLRRLLRSLLVLGGVTLVVFVLVELAGDPITIMLGEASASPADIARMRQRLGLDAPPAVRYVRFLGRAATGDLGVSLRYNQPALPIVLGRLPATVTLAVAGMLLALVVALPLGILAALRPRSAVDRVASLLIGLAQSIPLFWLGIMLVLVFAVWLRWLPPASKGTWQHLVMPAVTLALYPAARIARLLRSTLLEVLRQDYIRVAEAKGLPVYRIVLRHALRNAALPVVTVAGLMFGTMLSSAVITETIFVWPGVGLLSVQAVLTRDFPLVESIVVVVSLIFVLINLAVDLLYGVIDPRIRYS